MQNDPCGNFRTSRCWVVPCSEKRNKIARNFVSVSRGSAPSLIAPPRHFPSLSRQFTLANSLQGLGSRKMAPVTGNAKQDKPGGDSGALCHWPPLFLLLSFCFFNASGASSNIPIENCVSISLQEYGLLISRYLRYALSLWLRET